MLSEVFHLSVLKIWNNYACVIVKEVDLYVSEFIITSEIHQRTKKDFGAQEMAQEVKHLPGKHQN